MQLRPNLRTVAKTLVIGTAASLALAATPAFAQLEKVTATFTVIQAVLVSISVICFTIALCLAGYKYAFQHARWVDISNIVIGGILVGGSAAIAAWLAGTA